jgi:hypothetical protein
VQRYPKLWNRKGITNQGGGRATGKFEGDVGGRREDNRDIWGKGDKEKNGQKKLLGAWEMREAINTPPHL